MLYDIRILPGALDELNTLPQKARAQIIKKIDRLAADPFTPVCTQLEGKQNSGIYRIRSGDYRILYKVSAAQVVVTVVKIGNRKDIYREM
jgi:mRNA interferase RelE/StbE